jgi:hypothetical protein
VEANLEERPYGLTWDFWFYQTFIIGNMRTVQGDEVYDVGIATMVDY